MAEISAATQRKIVIGREKCFRQFCGSVSPVTMPSLAERYWIRMAIAFDHSSTQSSRYPNRLPPSILVAKFPGSIYATEATNAGPKYAHNSLCRNLNPRGASTVPVAGVSATAESATDSASISAYDDD